MDGHSYKRTAGALRDRRLVTISKRGGSWSAELTDAGAHYVEHGKHLDRVDVVGEGRDARLQCVSLRDRSEQRRAAAVRLVEQLIAERRVLIKLAGDEDLATWRKVIEFANRHQMAPDGKRITRYKRWGGLEVELCDNLSSDVACEPREELLPVPVPAQLRKPHAVVRALQQYPERLNVTKIVRSRALRIIQGLVVEAERRGYVALPVGSDSHRDRYRSSNSKYQFIIAVKDHPIEMRLVQEHDRVEHVPTAKELAEQQRYSWTRIPTHDQIPNAQLRLEFEAGLGARQGKWADRNSWTLEEKLPEVLREIAARGDAAEQRRLAEERARVEKRRRWEAAMAKAQQQAVEAWFAERLTKQVERWRQAGELRAYCDALEQRIATADSDADSLTSVIKWLSWARAYAERIDPLRELPAMSEPPESRPSDLQPFLGSWSPYGP